MKMQTKTLARTFLCLIFCSIFATCAVRAGAEDLAGGKSARLIAELSPPDAAESSPDIVALEKFTPSAKEIADLAGITPVLQDLQREQKAPVTMSPLSLAALNRQQRIIYLHEKLNTLVQAINLQVNSTRGKIDMAIANADETRALLTERRNRMTHRNSQINLVSGGITKIIGYSLALSPLTDIPTNVLEVFDGSVQTSLSGLALRQEKQEAKLEHGMPAILESFLNEAQGKTAFPPNVWSYLNELPATSLRAKSRRLALIGNWQKAGMIEKAHQTQTKRNQTIELLDQRKAMLSDFKSVIEEMHYGLMELNDSIMLTYKADSI